MAITTSINLPGIINMTNFQLEAFEYSQCSRPTHKGREHNPGITVQRCYFVVGRMITYAVEEDRFGVMASDLFRGWHRRDSACTQQQYKKMVQSPHRRGQTVFHTFDNFPEWIP